MCAMAYGTLTLVHATGGLRDSVKSFYADASIAIGFHIWPLSANSMKKVMFDVLDVYFRQPEVLATMRRHCDRALAL